VEIMLPEVGDRVDYRGQQRQVIGYLRYGLPPEPGTLVGPNGWGETCVVLGTVGSVTLIGRATRPDVDQAETDVAAPRSLFELAAMRKAGIRLLAGMNASER
jgi:hypothetical protein